MPRRRRPELATLPDPGGARRLIAMAAIGCLAPFLTGFADKDAGALGNPVALSAVDVRREPAPAVRADRWDGRIETPTDPVTIPLLCLAETQGNVVDCIVADDRGPVFKTTRDFLRAAGTDDVSPRTPSLAGLARARARQRVLQLRRGWGHFLFRTSETIGAADARPVAPVATPVLAMTDLRFERVPAPGLIERLFPASALRRGEGTRMLATCRVMPDRALFCRDGRQDPASPPLADPVRREFALATYQVAAEMRVAPKALDGSDPIGRDVTIAVNWFVG